MATTSPLRARPTPTDPLPATRRFRHATGARRAAVGAGIYTGAWIVGLTAFVAGPRDTSDAALTVWFSDHRASTAVQALLVHGIAAIALALVVSAASDRRIIGRASRIAGGLAVGWSLVQLALGLWRSIAAHGAAVASLAHAIDRLDGLKMTALAVMIGASVRTRPRTGRRVRLWHWIGALGTVSLLVAALAYGLAIDGLRAAAAPALLLLIAWVCRTGAITSRSESCPEPA